MSRHWYLFAILKCRSARLAFPYDVVRKSSEINVTKLCENDF